MLSNKQALEELDFHQDEVSVKPGACGTDDKPYATEHKHYKQNAISGALKSNGK